MHMRIVEVCEVTKPIASPIRNAYIDFSKMTASLVAVVTDVQREGRRVVGYGFNSNGRYGQGGPIRARFPGPVPAPRLASARGVPRGGRRFLGSGSNPSGRWGRGGLTGGPSGVRTTPPCP